jgi:hypothetical protein
MIHQPATPLAVDRTQDAAVGKRTHDAAHGVQSASGAPSRTYRSGGPRRPGRTQEPHPFPVAMTARPIEGPQS